MNFCDALEEKSKNVFNQLLDSYKLKQYEPKNSQKTKESHKSIRRGRWQKDWEKQKAF